MFNDLFPYDLIRPGQEKMMNFIYENLENNKISFVHAPTGIGKTVASLVPVLKFAMFNNYKIFFLSNRHEHHRIVFDTISAINKKTSFNIRVMNLVSKKYLCGYDVETQNINDFYDFCKKLRKDKACPYYNATYKNNSLTPAAKIFINELSSARSWNVWQLLPNIKEFCPYEIFLQLAKKAHILILDYYYVFNKSIFDSLLGKLGISADKVILVVDEAHNLPDRLRRMSSLKATGYTFKRAMDEVMDYDSYVAQDMKEILLNITLKMKKYLKKENKEGYVTRDFLVDIIESYYPYHSFIDMLYETAEQVYLKKRTSYANALKRFLELWDYDAENINRIAHLKENDKWELHVFDIDIASKAADVLLSTAGSVLMSATLLPLSMYREILGVKDRSASLALPSPFPKENAYVRAVLGLTTKYEYRNKEMYQKYASLISKLSNNLSHNILIFYPSYAIMENILSYTNFNKSKYVLIEHKDINAQEKEDMLFMLRESKDVVLNAVVGANFYEGVDFKGDMVKLVLIVGLPFEKPDLYNQSIISYYDRLFGKGKEYGYVIPSINKTLQSAGRCIRSEHEKGVILFLDERYRYPSYASLIKQYYSLKYVHYEALDYLIEDIDVFLSDSNNYK